MKLLAAPGLTRPKCALFLRHVALAVVASDVVAVRSSSSSSRSGDDVGPSAEEANSEEDDRGGVFPSVLVATNPSVLAAERALTALTAAPAASAEVTEGGEGAASEAKGATAAMVPVTHDVEERLVSGFGMRSHVAIMHLLAFFEDILRALREGSEVRREKSNLLDAGAANVDDDEEEDEEDDEEDVEGGEIGVGIGVDGPLWSWKARRPFARRLLQRIRGTGGVYRECNDIDNENADNESSEEQGEARSKAPACDVASFSSRQACQSADHALSGSCLQSNM